MAMNDDEDDVMTNEPAIHDESNLCCWGKIKVRILKAILFATFAFFALTSQLSLHTVYEKPGSANEKRVERVVLIVAVVITVGYFLAACLFAWFAILAYHAFNWQRINELPAYRSCVKEKSGF